MSDEQSKATPNEPVAGTTATAVPAPPPAAPPDPYAGLSDEDKWASQQFDDVAKTLSPQQRLSMLRWANKGMEVERSEWEKSQQPKPTPAPAAAHGDATAAALEAIRKEQAELRGMLTAKDQKAAADAEKAKLFSDIRGALDADPDYADDPELREDVETRVLGELIKHVDKGGNPRAFSPAAVTKRIIDGDKKKIARLTAKEKEGYVKGKIKAADETAGEAGGGTAPARKGTEFTADQYEKGDLSDLTGRKVLATE